MRVDEDLCSSRTPLLSLSQRKLPLSCSYEFTLVVLGYRLEVVCLSAGGEHETGAKAGARRLHPEAEATNLFASLGGESQHKGLRELRSAHAVAVVLDQDPFVASV